MSQVWTPIKKAKAPPKATVSLQKLQIYLGCFQNLFISGLSGKGWLALGGGCLPSMIDLADCWKAATVMMSLNLICRRHKEQATRRILLTLLKRRNFVVTRARKNMNDALGLNSFAHRALATHQHHSRRLAIEQLLKQSSPLR